LAQGKFILMLRVKLLISGSVQGVFFRQSAKLEAEKLGIVGWVKNRDDGNVEAMVEGEKAKIAEFIKWCKNGPPFAKVEKVEVEEQKGAEGFSEFSIQD